MSTRPNDTKKNLAREEARIKHEARCARQKEALEGPTTKVECASERSLSQSKYSEDTREFMGSSSSKSSSEEDLATWYCLVCGQEYPERVQLCRQCWTSRLADGAVQSRAAKGVRGRHDVKKE